MKEDGRLGRFLAWLEPKAPKVHRFLVRDDKPFPAVREALGIAMFLILLATVLWGATGQPFPESPVVVVESESMMHCQPPYASPGSSCQRASGVPFGRLGTIDPGDLIFVKDVEGRGDVESWAEAVGRCDSRHGTFQAALDCGCEGRDGYSACGDVIIFRKSVSAQATPVIHRALFWLEVHGGGRYSVDLPEEWGCTDLVRVPRQAPRDAAGHPQANGGLDASLCLSRLGAAGLGGNSELDRLQPADSGFITRGDNNDGVDQAGGNVEQLPVPPSRIIGKARGEVPWLGLVKLLATDLVGPTNNYARSPGDVKFLMWVSLGIIIAAPAAFEGLQRWRQRDKS